MITFIFPVLLVACSTSDTRTIPRDKMASIMTDVALSDQIINSYPAHQKDSMRIVLRESLLKIHNISRTELDTNLYFYMSDFAEFEKVLNLMVAKNASMTNSSSQ